MMNTDSDSVDGREPVLRVPEDRTVLPNVDSAMPVLETIATAVSRKRGRFNVAVLKSLQESGTGRWKIKEIQDALDWLEPQSATDLISGLRTSEILRYDALGNRYSMPPKVRAASAVMGALTAGVDPRRMIRFINKAMALAQAAGAGDDIMLSQFRSAVSQLRADLEELRGLLEDYSDSALREAADVIAFQVEDMRELLDEHEALLFRNRTDPELLRTEKEALGLVADLGGLCARVVGSVSDRADERMRSRSLIDRADLRDFLLDTSRDDLAALVDGNCVLSPRVPWLPADELFAALEEAASHHAAPPPPLPEPIPLEREVPTPQASPTDLMLDELAALVKPVSLRELIVRDTWGVAVERNTALLDAHSRLDVSARPCMGDEDGCEAVSDGGVWRISSTTIGPPA
jgi:hypothetical protein